MHRYHFTMKGQHHREPTIGDSVPEEPPEDFYDFEIISEEEIASLSCPFSISMSSSASSTSISSQGSSSSLGSTGTGPTVIRAPAHKSTFSTSSSSTSLSSGLSENDSTTSSSLLLTENELTPSVRIWYSIQLKGHYNTHDEDDHLETTEGYSSTSKKTGWLFNLVHLPERLKQNTANKNRFNLNSIPEETREELKHLYVY